MGDPSGKMKVIQTFPEHITKIMGTVKETLVDTEYRALFNWIEKLSNRSSNSQGLQKQLDIKKVSLETAESQVRNLDRELRAAKRKIIELESLGASDVKA